MHKFWAIAVGCALDSVGMGVAWYADTDRSEG